MSDETEAKEPSLTFEQLNDMSQQQVRDLATTLGIRHADFDRNQIELKNAIVAHLAADAPEVTPGPDGAAADKAAAEQTAAENKKAADEKAAADKEASDKKAAEAAEAKKSSEEQAQASADAQAAADKAVADKAAADANPVEPKAKAKADKKPKK